MDVCEVHTAVTIIDRREKNSVYADKFSNLIKMGIFVRSTEHRKVKIYVVELLGWAPPHFRKPRVKSWNSKNSVHDGIKHCIGKKCDKIFVKKSSFFSFFLRVDLVLINITMLTVAAQMFIAVWKQNAAEDLLAKKTTIVGTLRRNKTEVPSELTEAMGREVGSSLFCFDRQLTLVSYILKRKKCVLLLSTMHHDDAH
ncbi:hypothetical protein T02_12893 [Trichinella nativa]|uniref:PiggyBac transposable element-derived protein domain-containing protein n=1 Tax=Trichinella nativa TaxID=6335 RepID=A0A0V1KPJ7_9BILA|nr:hypothetical protein T02_12893 [Trichinella nativa]